MVLWGNARHGTDGAGLRSSPPDGASARPKNTNRGYMAEWNFYDRARKSSLRVTWRIIDMAAEFTFFLGGSWV